ncbi:MAG: M20 family metallopeptidase [Eubacteriales bacterium]|nr:M20 family metallopeptidase [Eubacteriales bacterium]
MKDQKRITKLAEQAIQTTIDLVRIDSTNPGAGESEISQWIYRRLQRLLEAPAPVGGQFVLRKEEILPDRPMVMLRIQPQITKEPALVMICHQDTVVVGDGWQAETGPFSAAIIDDRLYGRGACDMKAGLAVALTLMEDHISRIRGGEDWPQRELVLIASADEEDFMRGVEYAISAGWVAATDWVVDLEPTDGEIRVAHKGRTWIELTAIGQTAHASHPWEGVDAIAAIAEVITRFRQAVNQTKHHEELGQSTVTFGQIVGGYRPYVVPDRATVWIDLRLVPPTTGDRAVDMLQTAMEQVKLSVAGIEFQYKITGNRPYIEKNNDSPLLAAIRQASEVVIGQAATVSVFNGYTDTAVIAGKMKNPNCLSYGPGSLDLAHKPNEYVPLKDIRRCVAVYDQLLSD